MINSLLKTISNKKIVHKIIKNKWFLNIFLPLFSVFYVLFLWHLIITKNYLILIGILALTFLIIIIASKESLVKIKIDFILKLLLWITIITAITGPAFFAVPIGHYHLLLFRIFLPLILLLIFSQILLNQGKISGSLKKIKFYLLFIVIWFSYAILTLVWAYSKTKALENIYFLFVGFSLIFLIVLYFKKIKDLKNLYILWMIILVSFVGIGLLEMFTGYRLQSSGYFGTIWANKMIWPTAVFHNTNDFASFLVLSIPFIWVWLKYGKGKILKWSTGIILFTCVFFLLIKTSSRLNFFAVCLEIIFIFFYLLNINKKIKIIIILGFILILIFTIYPQFFSNPSNFFKNLLTYQNYSSSIASRGNIIKNSLYSLVDSFGFGVGAGNIEYYIARFAKYPIIGGILIPHNWWIEILADYGILIFIGYLLFYFNLIYSLWKIWYKINKRQEKMICEALLIALVGFLLSSIGPSSMIQLKYHWVFFGFALAFLNYYRLKYKTR